MNRRAVNVGLVRETKDNRVQGIIAAVRSESQYAFIDCIGHCDDNRVFVHFSEFTQPGAKVTEGAEVEFSLCNDQSGKASAARVIVLPKGTVKFEEVGTTLYSGSIVKPAKRGSKLGAASRGGHKGAGPQKGYDVRANGGG